MAAEKLTNKSVKMGRLIPVINQNNPYRHETGNSNSSSVSYNGEDAAANYFYFAVWVEDDHGGNERCLLFTKDDIEMAEKRAQDNTEDIPERSFIRDLLD